MIHAKPVLSEAEGARWREEVSEKVFHAETRRRGGVALAAQRLSHSSAEIDFLPASAGSLPSFSSASPRLRVNPIFFAPSRPLGFAQDRLRVNQNFSGTPHV